MKQLNDANFSDFVDELQDLVHKYAEGGQIIFSTEDGWTEFEISMPREEEDES